MGRPFRTASDDNGVEENINFVAMVPQRHSEESGRYNTLSGDSCTCPIVHRRPSSLCVHTPELEVLWMSHTCIQDCRHHATCPREVGNGS